MSAALGRKSLSLASHLFRSVPHHLSDKDGLTKSMKLTCDRMKMSLAWVALPSSYLTLGWTYGCPQDRVVFLAVGARTFRVSLRYEKKDETRRPLIFTCAFLTRPTFGHFEVCVSVSCARHLTKKLYILLETFHSFGPLHLLPLVSLYRNQMNNY